MALAAQHPADFPVYAPRASQPGRRLRVLFVNDTARNGGPGRSLHCILKFLDPALIHRAVLVPRPGVVSELLRHSGVVDELWFEPNLVENPFEPWGRAMQRQDFDAPLPLKAVRLLANVFKGARALGSVHGLLRASNGEIPFDLIYCNGTSADFAGAALALASGVPALWHVRYTAVPAVLEALHAELAASHAVRRIVCVSEAAAALFPHCKAKVRVIHNALDVGDFERSRVLPCLRSELGFSEDAVVFGSHGRVLPRKGYVEMIHAARLALESLSASERERARFVIVGDTPQDMRPDHVGECRALVSELGLERQIFLLGFRADVRPYVADFDVAVVPSIYPDPLPRAVIESMALGKPVLAFAMGGIREMVEDLRTGCLLPANPPEISSLAAAFVRYFRDPGLRSRQGAEARRAVEERFDGRAHGARIQHEIVEAAAPR